LKGFATNNLAASASEDAAAAAVVVAAGYGAPLSPKGKPVQDYL